MKLYVISADTYNDSWGSQISIFGVFDEEHVYDALEELQKEYPEMFDRMLKRKAYMKEVLGIHVSDDILPMCSTVAYLRPYLLDHGKVLVQR